MSRVTTDQYKNGFLYNGYDYERQAWVLDGVYQACNHPTSMWCGCFGRLNAGKPSLAREPK